MRIALIHYRLLRNGGLETRLFNYLNWFSVNGHEVTLVVSKIDPEVVLREDIRIEQVNLKRVPKPLRQYFFDNALSQVIPKGNFDLSFSLGRTSNQDFVLCPGNHLGYLKAMSIKWPSPIDRLNIFLDRQAYRKSKLVLAASEMMKTELADLYQVPNHNIKVLLPPIDTELFNQKLKSRKRELREKYGFSDKKKSLLFLTTGNKRKGYPFLLELMNELKDYPVELVVAGVKPMSTQLPNVKYMGYAEQSEELLAAADVLIHPALYEPFGQVITESIQCGTPVLVSNMVGAKEIVSKNVGAVVDGFNHSEWIKAIKQIIDKEFHIPIDFAQSHGLTVDQHCKQILNYAAEIYAKSV